MKRITWAILLSLCMCALLPAACLAAEGDANIAMQEDMLEQYGDGVLGACVFGDELCMYGTSHIFRYRLGDAAPTAVEYELPSESEETRGVETMFSDGERLYMLVSSMRSDEDSYRVEGLEILPVDLSGETAALGEGVEADLSQLTADYGGDNLYLVQINDSCCVDGYLMLSVYDNSGRESVYAMDVVSGEGKYVEGLSGGIAGIAPYEDGQLLIETCDYAARTCEFLAYEPESENLTSLCAPIELDEYAYGFDNIAYSPESGRLFYRADGYVMAMEDFDCANAQPVAELSTVYGYNKAGLLLPGDHYVYSSYDGTMVRSTDPGALPERRLVVRQINGYSDALMDAYYAFGNRHGDVAVVLDGSYSPSSALIEAMMNRDDSADIFMMGAASQAYDALFHRGYLAELDAPALTEAVGEMYPFLREVLERDGALVAVPVSAFGWVPALDYAGFEELGVPREEVPTSWKELIELLPSLAERLPEEGGIYIFDEYSDQETIRYQLYSAALDAWRVGQDAAGQTQRYDDPELAELLEEIAQLDLGALGVREREEGEDGIVYASGSGGGTHRLVQFSTGCTIGNFYSEGAEPAPLSALPGQEAWIPLDLTVAFVNPFSKNLDLAQEFLAELMANLNRQALYNFSDRYSEPVRDPHYEEYLESWEEELEKRRAELESADAIDRPAIQESIQQLEGMIADEDRFAWLISEKDIQWYRSHAGQMTVERFNFMFAEDSDGEIYDLRQQMIDGKLRPADYLKELDRQVRMRALEGN